ncbi:hypothetical protein HZ326_21281 [Fusarium oxysporum f. sp. albedinis]|nr:hypothetical protein HZ326_21281 [Fusarium oxysporum f. sp. albedinis]
MITFAQARLCPVGEISARAVGAKLLTGALSLVDVSSLMPCRVPCFNLSSCKTVKGRMPTLQMCPGVSDINPLTCRI